LKDQGKLLALESGTIFVFAPNTEIYLIYRCKLQSSADTVVYCEAAVQHLIKKEP
jgi:hypothetical protein